jgi:hypothetical protein
MQSFLSRATTGSLFNDAAERPFGYSRGEMIGRPMDLLIPARFRVAHQEHIARFTSGPDVPRRMAGLREVPGLPLHIAAHAHGGNWHGSDRNSAAQQSSQLPVGLQTTSAGSTPLSFVAVCETRSRPPEFPEIAVQHQTEDETEHVQAMIPTT